MLLDTLGTFSAVASAPPVPAAASTLVRLAWSPFGASGTRFCRHDGRQRCIGRGGRLVSRLAWRPRLARRMPFARLARRTGLARRACLALGLRLALWLPIAAPALLTLLRTGCLRFFLRSAARFAPSTAGVAAVCLALVAALVAAVLPATPIAIAAAVATVAEFARVAPRIAELTRLVGR